MLNFIRVLIYSSVAGAMGICFPYLGEFQPTKYREKILCWMEMFWTMGIIALPGKWIPLRHFNRRWFLNGQLMINQSCSEYLCAGTDQICWLYNVYVFNARAQYKTTHKKFQFQFKRSNRLRWVSGGSVANRSKTSDNVRSIDVSLRVVLPLNHCDLYHSNHNCICQFWDKQQCLWLHQYFETQSTNTSQWILQYSWISQ